MKCIGALSLCVGGIRYRVRCCCLPCSSVKGLFRKCSCFYQVNVIIHLDNSISARSYYTFPCHGSTNGFLIYRQRSNGLINAAGPRSSPDKIQILCTGTAHCNRARKFSLSTRANALFRRPYPFRPLAAEIFEMLFRAGICTCKRTDRPFRPAINARNARSRAYLCETCRRLPLLAPHVAPVFSLPRPALSEILDACPECSRGRRKDTGTGIERKAGGSG